MKLFQRLAGSLLGLFLFVSVLSAQTVNSITITPNQANCNSLLTANIMGDLPNNCTTISASTVVQGNQVKIYLTFTQGSGVCAQVITPFTQNVILGILPVGTYTVQVYNAATNTTLGSSVQLVVSCANCQPPTLGQLSCSNVTSSSLQFNVAAIPGATQYQFAYRQSPSTVNTIAPASTNNFLNLTNLQPNTTYLYCVRIYCNGAWTPYSPTQSCTTSQASGGTGTSCANPVMLTCGVAYSGSTASGTSSFSNYTFPNGATFSNMTGKEAFHKFTLTQTSNVTISLTGLSADLDLFLLTNCNSNCNTTAGLAYSGNGSTSNETITINNLPAGTYTVLVDGWGGAWSNYNLVVNCGSAMTCAAPTTSQIYFTNATSTSVRINTSASGTYYDWAYRTGSGAWVNLPATTQNYYDVTGLLPGTTYQFVVSVKCSNGVWSNWSAVCYTTLPSSNPGCSCGSAIPISCGQSHGSNNGAGANNLVNYTFNGQTHAETGPEVFYKLVLTSTTTVSISLTNLYCDLDLFLLNGCSGSNVIAQSGNSNASNEQINVTLAPGTYYIVVDGWNGGTSNYLLSVLCGNGGGNTCSNDNPCGAQVLGAYATCQNILGTSVGSTTTTNPVPSSGCNSLNMKDVWYAVQMPATGRMRVNLAPGTLTDALLGIYSGNSCTSLCCYGCIDNTNGDLMPDVTIMAAPGTWIYLRVWGYNGSVGTFSICVTIQSGTGNLVSEEDESLFTIAESADLAERADDEAPDMTDEAATESLSTAMYSLKVFPTPTQDEVNIQAIVPAEQAVDIHVFDLNGRLVKQLRSPESADGNLLERLEVSDLPPGLYILKVRAGETELTSKFSRI